MKKNNRNKGFTLVEIIVVIVIAGILLAILVPGMFKYIQRAKEKQAIVECRAVVTAADTLALELYAKDEFDELIFSTHNNEIIENADVDGNIRSLSFEKNKPTLANLTYLTKSNIKVLYDKSQASVYQIVSEGIFSSNASGYHDFSQEVLNFEEVVKKTGADNKSKEMQKIFNEKYNNSTLSESEKELFNGISNKVNWENYHWSPIYTKDNKLIIVASKDPYESGQSKRNNTSVIYYEGSYYYFCKNKSNPIGTRYVDVAFDTKLLDNAPKELPTTSSDSQILDLWIKLDTP